MAEILSELTAVKRSTTPRGSALLSITLQRVSAGRSGHLATNDCHWDIPKVKDQVEDSSLIADSSHQPADFVRPGTT